MKRDMVRKLLKLLAFLLWRSELPNNVFVAHLFMQQQIFTECRSLLGRIPGSGDTVMNQSLASALQGAGVLGRVDSEFRDRDRGGLVKSFSRCGAITLYHTVPPVCRLLRAPFTQLPRR